MARCTAKTLKGSQCKNAALDGSTKCKMHSSSSGGTPKVKTTAVKKAPKKVKATVKKAPKKAKTSRKLSKYALQIEEGIQAGYHIPESDVHHYRLEKRGALSARQIQVFEKLRNSKLISEVEFNKKGDVLTFFIERSPSNYNDGDENDRAEQEIIKLMKKDRYDLEISNFDEERLGWYGKLSMPTFLTK